MSLRLAAGAWDTRPFPQLAGATAMPPSPAGTDGLREVGMIGAQALIRGMGVPASRAVTAAEFARQLRQALAEPGPHLIEAVVPAPSWSSAG